MPCCGKNRSAAVATIRSAADASAMRPSGVPAGNASRAVHFEYRGGHTLSVVGQGTGYHYRFVGYGARLSVDPRDRASLAVVPHLREA